MGESEEQALGAATSAPVTVPPKPVPAPPPPASPSQKLSLLGQWKSLSRRSRIILLAFVLILAVAVATIALIIGLAAGLSRRKGGAQNLPLPGGHGGPYTGDLTYYQPGLGACGVTSSNRDKIVAISHVVFDAASAVSNPNANPLCGKKIRARRNNRSVDLTVVDRCVGCQPNDIDVTVHTFAKLAEIEQGRVLVEWNWLEDVPTGAQA